MRRRVMTIAMATFFAGMMAFCDVDIIAAEENVVTEATTETAIISTTEEVTTEQNQSELKNNTTKVENKVTISKIIYILIKQILFGITIICHYDQQAVDRQRLQSVFLI